MHELQKLECLGANYYRLDVPSVQGYLGGEFGTIPAAPLIHTYSPMLSSISAKLALFLPGSKVLMNGRPYQVKRFLTVQSLDHAFLLDEANNFWPAVKPHYAIESKNKKGEVYKQACKTLLVDEQGIILNKPQNVHVHDRKVSPALCVKNLKEKIEEAFQQGQSLFVNSYVVDEVYKQVLITQHCLLNEDEFALLSHYLDSSPKPSLESLVEQPTFLQAPLLEFLSDRPAAQVFMDAVFSGNNPEKPLRITNEPILVSEIASTSGYEPQDDKDVLLEQYSPPKQDYIDSSTNLVSERHYDKQASGLDGDASPLPDITFTLTTAPLIPPEPASPTCSEAQGCSQFGLEQDLPYHQVVATSLVSTVSESGIQKRLVSEAVDAPIEIVSGNELDVEVAEVRDELGSASKYADFGYDCGTQDEANESLNSYSAKDSGGCSSFLLKALAVSAIAIGFVLLSVFSFGIGTAIATGASAVAAGYTVGIVGSGLLIAGGFWSVSRDNVDDSEAFTSELTF